MRKLISLMLAIALALSLTCVLAEDVDDTFLVSDWQIVYSYEGSVFAQATVFLYEDHTYEGMEDNVKGTWSFDGMTLEFEQAGEILSLQWDEAAQQFTGEYSGMTLTMSVPVEPESGEYLPDDTTEETELSGGGMLAGGWAVAEDPTVTDDLNNKLWQALDSYQTGTVTVAYTPVAYLGSQVVAGTNYAILCRSQEINQQPTLVIIYLYEDLEGNVSVLSIADLALGV